LLHFDCLEFGLSCPIYQKILYAQKPGKGILFTGSEAHGISRALYPFINEPIRIPDVAGNGAESLNVAVATALVCYAFVML
jgi:tRNA G18 (ribose-2'-O)-methylase SpoU